MHYRHWATCLVVAAMLFSVLQLVAVGAAQDVQAQTAGPGLACPAGSVGDVQLADSGASDPDDALQQWVDDTYTGQTTRDFGETGSDKYFSHTFDVPAGFEVVGGFLEMDVGSGATNDTIRVAADWQVTPAWGDTLAAQGIADGQRSTLTFDLANMPVTTPATATDLIDDIDSIGSVDVLLQDDSAVYSLELSLCVIPPIVVDCEQGELVELLADSGASDPDDALQQWVDDFYTGQTTRDFGETGSDKYFSHTFDVPAGFDVVGGFLEMDVESGATNDTMGVTADWQVTPSWGDSLAAQGIADGQRDTLLFDLANMPATTSTTATATDLIDDIDSIGSVDVLLQDDSAVYSLKLTLCLVPSAVVTVVNPPTSVTVVGNNGGGGTVVTLLGQPFDIQYVGCTGATVTYEFRLGMVNGGSGAVLASGTMVEGPLGVYVATVPATSQWGNAIMSLDVTCPDNSTEDIIFDIYIDPSGLVLNQLGQAVEGATVELLRADTAAGPFTLVPDGSLIMSPENRSNPVVTGADGFYRWDVTSGFYITRASAPNCANPVDGSSTVTSDILPVPPIQVEIDLVMNCPIDLQCNGLTATVDLGALVPGSPTEGDDVIVGTSGPDTIDGLGGNDTICGLGGADALTGGDGNDSMFGGPNRDIIRGNAGVDYIEGGEGNDRLLGGIDGDTIYGGVGNDYLGGFGGDDQLFGGEGDEVIFGGFGADTIDAGPGDDEVSGLIGDDVINGGDGDDVLNGDRGNDTLNGGAGNDTLRGGNANDIVNGDAGDDSVSGGKADDTLSGGDGTDVCVGNKENNADIALDDCESKFGVP